MSYIWLGLKFMHTVEYKVCWYNHPAFLVVGFVICIFNIIHRKFANWDILSFVLNMYQLLVIAIFLIAIFCNNFRKIKHSGILQPNVWYVLVMYWLKFFPFLTLFSSMRQLFYKPVNREKTWITMCRFHSLNKQHKLIQRENW